MRLLDPGFDYVPAAATDITVTWQRFGFDPRLNEERRARLKVTGVTRRGPDEILRTSAPRRLRLRS